MDKIKRKAIIVSGYFNPVHKGHLELFQKSKEKAEYLAMHFKVSTREAYDYLKILDKKTIKSIIKNYKNDTSRKAIQSTKK